jgi:hypothetical protein
MALFNSYVNLQDVKIWKSVHDMNMRQWWFIDMAKNGGLTWFNQLNLET